MSVQALLLLSLAATWSVTAAEQPRITVHADRVQHRVSPYLTGACIEDVNHEIYGGLYSQMIFGESFQEPPTSPPLAGFTAFGGRWVPHGDELSADAGDGPKLIADAPLISTGEVGVEILLPGQKPGNAGLILKVNEAASGADKFTGYEVSLDTSGRLILGRHRQNWEPLTNAPCPVPVDRWISLVVRLQDRSLEILVDGKSVLEHDDNDHPLSAGKAGLRTWQRDARYRHFYVAENGQRQNLTFDPAFPQTSGEVSGQWQGFRRGTVQAAFALDTQNPLTGHQSQRLSFTSGQGDAGLANRGLNGWGMNFIRGKRYEGFIFLRAPEPTDVFLALENSDGSQSYAEIRLRSRGDQWQRIPFSLKPRASDRNGRFTISLKRRGTVEVGYVFLEPGDWGRFKGLPVRKDVAEGLVAQGLTVLRYGGSMVNADEYRWKKMIGPPERRPPYRGTWYPYSSNGWGIFDFLNFCDAAHFLGIPAVNMGETPEDMADFMEYVNGSATSPWGRRRVAGGHPEPYHLKYLELGNEEAVDEKYWLRFQRLAETIWSKDPEVVLVVGDFAYDKAIEDPYHFEGSPVVHSLAAHEKILTLARSRGREVWFDVHIGTEEPPAPHGVPGVKSFIQQLSRIAPDANFKVAIFEFNAGNHAMKRALANACALNQIEQIGDQIPICCSANCLQPDGQNDNGWDQGLLFLNPSQVWPQPPYFVTRMFAHNYLPSSIQVELQHIGPGLDIAAKRSQDARQVVLQVVNTGPSPITAGLTVSGFVPRQSNAKVTVLAADPAAVNTAAQPGLVASKESDWPHNLKQGQSQFSFAPHSVTILRFR
jgi:hypothetical protein